MITFLYFPGKQFIFVCLVLEVIEDEPATVNLFEIYNNNENIDSLDKMLNLTVICK